MLNSKCYHCRYCGTILPAWLPAAKRPNGAMLLTHLSQHHRAELVLKRLLARMRTEEIGTVAAEAFEVIEDDASRQPLC
jgi:hypothetical protein